MGAQPLTMASEPRGISGSGGSGSAVMMGDEMAMEHIMETVIFLPSTAQLMDGRPMVAELPLRERANWLMTLSSETITSAEDWSYYAPLPPFDLWPMMA